ncbi:MAG TPA: hypothetical protein PKL83_01940 [bacterium]|nr:hypothetical protein [bacterium]
MRANIEQLFAALGSMKIKSLTVAVLFALGILRLVIAVVHAVIMPVFGAFTETGSWTAMELKLGSVSFGVGVLISELIIFGFLLWIIYGIIGVRGEDS